MNVRIDALGGLFTAGLGAYIVYGPNNEGERASGTGFSLTMAGMFECDPDHRQTVYCIVS